MSPELPHRTRSKLALAVSCLLASTVALGQTTTELPARVTGSVYTLDDAKERAVVPGATVRLQGVGAPFVTTTDEVGRFTAALAPGKYRITVEFPGMEAAPAEVDLLADKQETVDIELRPARVKESVTVSAQTESVDTAETSSKAVLQESTVANAPNSNERVESILPLIPGVVRGPDGFINMKGARTSQGQVLVNSANVSDPVTGTAGMNLPIDVVSTAQVVANPYDPEFGKLAGAVATIETRISEFNKPRVRVQNIMPRLRQRGGDIVGVGAFTPRVTVSGPIIRNRVAFTQSMEYRFVRTPVETQPPMSRDTTLESFDSYSQFDLSLTDTQSASATVAFYPQKQNYLGLNTFRPQPATPDLRQRGYFLAFSHKYVSPSGGLLASHLSYKTLDGDIKAHSDDLFRIGVDTATGGFFNRESRDTGRIEWQEVYAMRPVERYGRHQLKFGVNLVRNAYDGWHSFRSVEVLRQSGLVAERIDYSPDVNTSITQREYTAFVLNKWTPLPGITLDAGLRADRDSVSDEGHVAPRLGFAIAPKGTVRTVIRGGIGYFYDRVNLNIPTFSLLPARTITRYLPSGLASSRTLYEQRLADSIDNPRSTAWNVEVEREVTRDLVVRMGLSQRNTVRDFFVEPAEYEGRGALYLFNQGRSRYREFQATARYQFKRHVVNGSYVRSSAIGDLNDLNQFFGNNPTPIIRPNERSRLAFDAPNRFLLWGQFEAPWNITVAPVLDIHTGFPYSTADDERNFIGRRNRAGRYPWFSSFDFQTTKRVRLVGPMHKLHANIGLRVFNLFNHFNPRDFQQVTTSPEFGGFYNGVGRTFRGKFALEF
ncbi:MAG: carboxypeptidase regulatory-like domain-containing protein [Bryobacteraceae bacterium]|nr:carboxypeptidase regulatory-like domain-containing protein [Bryobacteraceae bacterium]